MVSNLYLILNHVTLLVVELDMDLIVDYQNWLEDVKNQINAEEGVGKYNEYLRCMFQTYDICNNMEFRDGIKD